MASEGAACAQLGVERLSYLLDGLRRLQDRCVAPAPCDRAAVQPADSNVCSKAHRRIPTPVSPGGGVGWGGLSPRLSANWTRRSRARKSVAICKYADVYPPPGPCGFQHAVTDSVSRYVCRSAPGAQGGRVGAAVNRQECTTQDCPQTKRPRDNLCGYAVSAHRGRLIDTYGRKHWLTCKIRHLDGGGRGGWGGCPGDTD